MNTVYCETCTRELFRWDLVDGAVHIDGLGYIAAPKPGGSTPFVVSGHRLMVVASPVCIEQVGCPGSGSVGLPPTLGEVIRSILDDRPRLEGIVALARSRSEWYIASPWSGAVTGPHPVVVANQAFAHKTLATSLAAAGRSGSFYLPLLLRLRRYETVLIERRGDVVRVTSKTATDGHSAWSNEFAPGQTSFDAETLDAVMVDLIDQLYPPLPELEDVRGVVARMQTHGLVDEYRGQLVNDWAYRWLSRSRRAVLGSSTENEEVKALARVLEVDEAVVRAIVCPRRPAIYPCGCSIVKVDAGRCDEYRPGTFP